MSGVTPHFTAIAEVFRRVVAGEAGNTGKAGNIGNAGSIEDTGNIGTRGTPGRGSLTTISGQHRIRHRIACM
ncbi:MAG: hypothetical protein ACLR93_06485 [Alistipes onderdonkii]